MRIRDIILEADINISAIEDEADSRGDAALITVLEWLRHEAEQSAAVTPRVAVDTVIERVRDIAGNEAFNFAALDAAFKSNDTVKTLVKSIKDDEKTGGKYVYLSPPESTVDPEEFGSSNLPDEQSSKIVGKMADRAAKNR